MQDTSLILDEVLNSKMYGLLFCITIYRSYELSSLVWFLWLKLIGIFGAVSFLWIYAKTIQIRQHSKHSLTTNKELNSEHFYILDAFLRHHIQELCTFKMVWFFGPPCIIHSAKHRKKADYDPSGSQNPLTSFDKTWHGWLHAGVPGPHRTWQLRWGSTTWVVCANTRLVKSLVKYHRRNTSTWHLVQPVHVADCRSARRLESWKRLSLSHLLLISRLHKLLTFSTIFLLFMLCL